MPAYESLRYLYNGMVFSPDSTEFTEGLGVAYTRVDEIPEAAFQYAAGITPSERRVQRYSEAIGGTTVSKASLRNKFQIGYMGKPITKLVYKQVRLVEAVPDSVTGRRDDIPVISFNEFAGWNAEPYICADYARDGKSTNMYLFGKGDPHPMVRINLGQIAELIYQNQEEFTIEEFITMDYISYKIATDLFEQLFESELKRYFDEGLKVSEAALSRIESGLSKSFFDEDGIYTENDLSDYYYVSHEIPYTEETFRILMGSAIATIIEEDGKRICKDKNDGVIAVHEYEEGSWYFMEGTGYESWPLIDLLKVTAPEMESYDGATINKTIRMMDITCAHFISPFLMNQELIDEAVKRYDVIPIDDWDYYDNVAGSGSHYGVDATGR